jgi:TP901 family phage tail tape measure protein
MTARQIQAGRAVVEVSLRDRIGKGLAAVERKLAATGRSIATLGTAVAVGVGGPMLAVGKIFGGFDEQMSRVSAVTGASADAMAKLREEAKRLGSTTQFTASQAAEGMSYLGMAGFTTEQILAGIGPVLNVAAAGMMDLGRAADIVSDATTAFGLSAEETARVADVMAKTATSSNTTIEQMGEAFVYAAAQGKSAGQTIEGVSAALGILGNSGLKASIAGTGVQGIFKRLIEPDAIAALNAMGVAFADAQGNIRPLTALMADLQTATSRMTQLKKLQTFESLFGLHAKSAIILADNADQLGEMTDKLYGAEGAAAAMAKEMNNNLMGSFKGLASAAESIVIAIGEAIAGPARAVMDFGAMVLRAGTAILDANRPIVAIIGKVAGVVAIAAAAFAGIGVAIMAASAVVGVFGAIWGAVTGAIGFIFSPLGAVVVALGAAAVAAYYFRDAIAEGITAAANYFRPLIDAVGEVWAVFQTTFGGIVSALSAGELESAAAIAWAGFVAASWTGVAGLGGVVNTALDFLGAWIPGVDAIRHYMTEAFAGIGNAILAGRWDLAGHIIMAKLQLVWTNGVDVLRDLWDIFLAGNKMAFMAMADIIVDVWNGAVQAIARGITWVMEKIGLASKGALAELQKMQDAENRARQGKRDQRANPLEQMYGRMNDRAAQRNAMAAGIRELEAQANAAYTQAGAPTLQGRAAVSRKALDDAIAAAEAERKNAGKDVPGAPKKAPALAGGAASTVAKVESRGSFSAAAAALFGLGTGGDAGERTATNTQLIATRIKYLNDKLGAGATV